MPASESGRYMSLLEQNGGEAVDVADRLGRRSLQEPTQDTGLKARRYKTGEKNRSLTPAKGAGVRDDTLS
jgi:hypothetical protein